MLILCLSSTLFG